MALRLTSNLIMTRLLMPEAFGLMMMIITIHAGLAMFSDIGIRPAVIRSDRGEEPAYLRTAWTMQILQHTLLGGILLLISLGLFLAAEHVDFGTSVFGDPDFPGLLAFSTVALMAQGLRSTNQFLAVRKLALKKIVVIEILSQIVGIVCMVVIASIILSVWALVCGMVIGAVMHAVLSHILLPGPSMALTWATEHVSEIWGFGKWLIGSSTFGFFANSGDRLVLGILLDKETFGLYAIAFLWVSILFTSTQKIMGGPGIAALSEIRRERSQDLPHAFKRLRGILSIIGFATALGFILFGNALIDLLYPAEYAQAGDFVGLLAGLMLFLGYISVGPMLLNLGDSKRLAFATLISCVTMLGFVPLAFIYLGQTWAIAFVAINQFWAIPAMLTAISRHFYLDLRIEFLKIALILLVFMSYIAFLA